MRLNHLLFLVVLSSLIGCSSHQRALKSLAAAGYQPDRQTLSYDSLKRELLVPYERYFRQLKTDKDVFFVQKGRYSGWKEVFRAARGKSVILLEPGDYRAWGALVVEKGGTADRPIIIANATYHKRKSSALIHPVDQAASERVYIEQFEFKGVYDAKKETQQDQTIGYAMISGLTVSGQQQRSTLPKSLDYRKVGGKSNWIRYGHHIIVADCLIENVIGKNCLKIRGKDNLVYRCVIRNAHRRPGLDNIGITLHPTKWYDTDRNILLENEIYNCTDGIQIVFKYKSDLHEGYASGSVLMDNTIYLTEDFYLKKGKETYSCAETGIALKVGGRTNTVEDRVLILRNTVSGMRITDANCGGNGSKGAAINLTHEVNNVLIEGNILVDNTEGIVLSSKNPRARAQRQVNVTINNNFIGYIQSAYIESFAIRMYIGATVTNNTFWQCKSWIRSAWNARTQIAENLIVEVEHPSLWTNHKSDQLQENTWYQDSQVLVKNGTSSTEILQVKVDKAKLFKPIERPIRSKNENSQNITYPIYQWKSS